MNRRVASYIQRVSKPQKENVADDMHFRLAIGFIESRLASGTRYNLLDLGCNVPPAFLQHMTARHPYITGFGCDIREGTPPSPLREGNIEIRFMDISDPCGAFEPSSFDFVFAGEVIEHLKDTDGLVLQARTYLKSGGYFVVTTPNLAAWYERLLLLAGVLPVMCEVSDSSRMFGRSRIYRLMGKTESRAVGHLRLFTPSALRDLCEYHGFEFVEHRAFWTMDFFLNRWISRARKNLAQGIFMVFRKP